MSMKKILSFMLISVMVLGMSGCSKTTARKESSQDAADYIESAIEKAAEITGYDGNIDLSFDFVNNSGNLTANVQTDIYVYDVYNRYIEINTNYNDETSGRSEFYVKEPQLAGGDATLYMLYDQEWYQSDADDDTLYYLLGQYDLPEILRIFLVAASGAEVIGNESVEGNLATRVDAVIEADLVAGALIYTGVFVATGMTALTENYFNGVDEMPISFWFDKDGFLIKAEFDAGNAYQTISDNLFNAVKDMEGYEDAEKLVINSYAMTIVLEDINDTDKIDYPADVLNATLLEE